MARDVFEVTAAGYTVLAPNTELATALFDQVERMHVEAGHEVWPTPRIRDFSGWLREQYLERQLSDATLPRVLNDIEERELWRAVILESDMGGELLEPAGAARAARRARRAMVEYGIPESVLALHATEESLALLDWTRRFERRCLELECISSELLLPSTPVASLDIAWLDSSLWHPIARSWLETHGSCRMTPDPVDGTAYRHQAASSAAELAAMASWASDKLAGNPKFRAWICIPDLSLRRAEVVDAFDSVLAPERYSLEPGASMAPYALAGGTPLADYPPVRAALSVLSATSGRISFVTFSALLRMPELQPAAADASAAASLDLKLRRRAKDEASLGEWLRLARELHSEHAVRPVPAVERLAGFLSRLENARGVHPMSRWVSWWVEAFDAGPWSERARWSSLEFQAAERFRELLASLAAGDRFFAVLSATSAAGVLRRAAHETMFQPQTGIPAVWVSSQLMDPWISYDGIWVAGCSEERWPPPLDPIPLLPVRVQREYGVVAASVELQLGQAEELQRGWQSRARCSVFSCADPGDGRASSVSPLVPAAAAAWVTEPVPQPHWQALARAAPTFEKVLDEQAPPFAAPERTRGVATLKGQSLCAFRGFAETRLLLEALDRPVPGFNARERGDMLHSALERIWTELQSWSALMAGTDQQLDALIGESVLEAIATQCRRRDPGERWRRREAPRLRMLLRKWLDTEKLREPFEVERLEHGAQIARHGGLDYQVRIDRIDRLVDGGRVLIDYKSGMANADWRGDRPDNPQLPIYALLRPEALVAVAYGRVNAAECVFIAESERGAIFKPRGRPSHLEGLPNFAALVARWSIRIEIIAREFARGDARVAPTLRACASCGLQPLCRVPLALDEAVQNHD